MVRSAVVTPTPTPEPQKPPQGKPEGAGGTTTKSFVKGQGFGPLQDEKPEDVASAAFQKALSQAAQRGYIDESEVVRVIKDKDIWNDLWLRYQVMTGYPKIGEKGYNPAKPEEVFTTALLEKGITYYTNAYVVQAVRVMPSQGIDPKNWSASLQKGIDAIREWRYTEELEEGPEQAARNASLGYAVSEQAEAQDKQAYLELLSTLNRQGYVDVYNALKTNFPSIYSRWKALEADYPGLTRNDFDTYLNRYIAPAVGEVDPTQSGAEFLKGMRRNLENLERLDTGRELIPEEGYRVDEETGEVVPVSTEALKAARAGKTVGPPIKLTKAEIYAKKGYVPARPGQEGAKEDDDGDWWINPDVEREKERLKTEAEMGRAGAAAEERAVRQMEEAGLKAARQSAIEAATKYAQEERIAAQVAPYTGTVSPETSAREAFNVGRRNLGALEAGFGGGAGSGYVGTGGGRAAYEDALLGSNIEEKFGAGRLRSEFPTPSAGYETRVGGRFGTTNPLEISTRLQAERDPLLRQRLAEPLAQQFPDLWEEFSQKRAYGWEKGPGHVAASQFSGQEPFDMPLESFVRQRLAPDTRNPVWAQPPKEGEVRTPIANWGFKQPWEGGPAPRGFSQPRPTAGPARMTPIRIGARR